jgi:hypothetical protein
LVRKLKNTAEVWFLLKKYGSICHDEKNKASYRRVITAGAAFLEEYKLLLFIELFSR